MGRGKVKLNLRGSVWALRAGYQEPEQQRPGLNQGQLVSVNLAGKTSLFPVSSLPAAPNTVTQRFPTRSRWVSGVNKCHQRRGGKKSVGETQLKCEV